ncbi:MULTISPECIES: helix-turn-helix transcriptional regulator [Streptomyces]|uniref:DNA-binding protein n=1 Tax=Streptomyces wadayamensis TaxID=141454 RepID=A0ABR4S926_9ACTN|nr:MULTISPECIES: helix-turn-helix transcriptional regulator [Streptomyces]KDR62153.1 DNA-binding protein [Streptomyces wadayamensis]MBV7250815.1 helix-turn-helix domain-containing protein [Streptomyces sp. S-2]QXQ26926.1 helix-turn-helix domain-containing protein [Streptomyces albidoflavus]QXQ32853.1 helix-turn-helix domain-containing protein [Streptomyces albidoflavus]WJK66735.1 helix-turn-helix transcriptional regulator [Streptomyces albidoflavus]
MTYAGMKVKDARKRTGLTQRQLAEHSGVSLSTIRKLEQGERSGARMETMHALARALRLPTMSLVTEPDEEGARAETRELWEPVRAELMRPPSRQIDAPATPSGVSEVLATTVPLYRNHRFSELASMLPTLLRDADTLPDEGRSVRVRVLQLAASALTHTRQFDLAEIVVRRALAEGQDRMSAAASVNTLAWLLLRQGRLDEALSLATQWADDMEPRLSRASTAELATWGLLLLRASGAAARNNQAGVAADMLRLARSAATAIGHEVDAEHQNVRTFGPTSVRMLSVEDALIKDRPDVALRLAENMPRYSVRPTRSVRSRHGLDVANAHARLGQFTEAFGKLTEVQAGSPEWFLNQTSAQHTLQTIIDGRRTLTPEMRHMADTLRLER